MRPNLLSGKIFGAAFFLLSTLFMSSCSVKSGAPEPSQPSVLSIKSISPTKAKVGETVTIKGSGFGNESSLIRIYFGYSALVRPTTYNDTMLTAIVPPDATDGRIMVSMLIGGSISSDQLFGVLADEPDYYNYNKIQFTGSGVLSSSRTGMAAAGVGDKIVFAGGTVTGSENLDVDIYDIIGNSWQSARISEPRTQVSVAGVRDKILIAGGQSGNGYSKTVDIYDITTGKWTISQLSVPRKNMGAIGTGSMIYFAGGEGPNGPSDVIDIYNAVTNTWSTDKLSVARSGLVVSALGGKIVFAGGEGNEPLAQRGRVVDIYDTDAPKVPREAPWSTALLSVGRSTSRGLAVAAAGRRMIFGGGGDVLDPHMDLYDPVDKKWSTMQISDEISTGAAAAAGTKIVFSFGKGRVWIYDGLSNSATTVYHSGLATPIAAAGTKNKIVFAGATDKAYDTFTVFK